MYTLDSSYLSREIELPGVNVGDKEYAIAQTIQFPDEYYGYIGLSAAIYDIQGVTQRTGGKTYSSIGNIQNISTPIVINNQLEYFQNLELLRTKSFPSYIRRIHLLSLKNQVNINSIYDLGTIDILLRS
jgi:hypothetical protein